MYLSVDGRERHSVGALIASLGITSKAPPAGLKGKGAHIRSVNQNCIQEQGNLSP